MAENIQKQFKKYRFFIVILLTKGLCAGLHNHLQMNLTLTEFIQALFGSGITWKVMEFIIVISSPGKSCNLSECRGKSWKSNMLPVKRQKD